MYRLSFAAFSSVAVVLLLNGSAFAGMENPKTNQASYWGENCTKTEINGDVKTYSVTDGSVNKVIVKGGTDYTVYEDGNFNNLTAPVNPKNKNGTTYGISHVIECKGPVNPVDPQEPTEPTNPTEPTDPTDPTDPQEPTEPVNPVNPGGGTDTPEGGKGGPTELPSELPKTGADSNIAAYFTLATGVSILVALVGYKGALTFITSRLN